MPPRRLRRPLEELAARAIARMSPGTLAGRVESASPARRIADPRMSQARGPGCPCPVGVRLCTPSGPSGETGEGVYRDAVLALNPVGYWRLDDVAGTVAADASTNSNDGTYDGDKTLGEPGLMDDGTSVYFPRTFDSFDRVKVSGISAYEITSNLSVAFWFKLDGTHGSGRGPVWMNGAVEGLAWRYGETSIRSGAAIGYAFSGAFGGVRVDLVPDYPIELGLTYFVVLWYDGSDTRVYINGCLEGEQAQTGSLQYETSKNFGIAGCPVRPGEDTAFNWKGWVDEVAIFDTALSESQIQNLYGIGTSFLGDGCFSAPEPCSLQASDDVLLVDASAGAASIALPPALLAHNHIYYVKKIDATASIVTLNPDGAEQIDGMSTYQLLDPMDAVGFVSDGASWWTVADTLHVGS